MNVINIVHSFNSQSTIINLCIVILSPDRTYNISSKTGPNDQNYEEISRQFNDHKERRLLAAFEDNKP